MSEGTELESRTPDVAPAGAPARGALLRAGGLRGGRRRSVTATEDAGPATSPGARRRWGGRRRAGGRPPSTASARAWSPKHIDRRVAVAESRGGASRPATRAVDRAYRRALRRPGATAPSSPRPPPWPAARPRPRTSTGRPLAAANAALPWPEARTSSSGTRRRSCASTGGTATSPPCSWRPRPGRVAGVLRGGRRRVRRRCSRAAAGAGRSGRPPGNASPRAAWWTPAVRPRRPGRALRRRSSERTDRLAAAPWRVARRADAATASWSCWGRCGWRCSAPGCCRPRRRWASGRSETAPGAGRV